MPISTNITPATAFLDNLRELMMTPAYFGSASVFRGDEQDSARPTCIIVDTAGPATPLGGEGSPFWKIPALAILWLKPGISTATRDDLVGNFRKVLMDRIDPADPSPLYRAPLASRLTSGSVTVDDCVAFKEQEASDVDGGLEYTVEFTALVRATP